MSSFFVLLLSGFSLGLLSATVTESLGHEFTGHPAAWQRRLYFKYPRIFFPFLRPLYQHLVIHHHKTFQGEFFDQFKSEKNKLEVDRWIAERFSPDFSSLVWRERYNLTLEGFVGTIPFAIPFCLGPLLIWLGLGPVALVGSLLSAFIPVWLSKYVHPLIHLPEETAKAHPFIQWLMRTRYMRRVLRNHFLHHQSQETNFNLLLGGDYLVFNHRKASFEEEVELARLLPEFDRRVRAEFSSEAAVSFASDSAQSEREKDYLSLENPNFDQRFRSQLERAQANRGTPPMDLLGLRDFGMKVYDKGIQLETWYDRDDFVLESYGPSEGEHRIQYRGLSFETGDVLLTNQNSDSDGLFSTLLDGPINFSHAALFAILPFRGRKLPAVIEMNEYGVRAVPLKALLSDRFNTYVEVFKPRKPLSSAQQGEISRVSLEMISENHAFDIYQDDTQTYYLNCARTITEIYRRAGLESITPESRYSRKTVPNLRILGIGDAEDRSFLMPDDFARSPSFRLSGVIDNGCFEDVLARGLVREGIQRIWRGEVLDQRRFPASYYLNRFVIGSIQRGARYSSLLLRMIGMKREHFPSGPIVFLSLTPIGNQRMEAATRQLREELVAHRERIYRMGSWASLWDDPQISTLVTDATSSFRGMYKENRKALQLFHSKQDLRKDGWASV